MAESKGVLPSIFISHGGGPCFFMGSSGHPLSKALNKDSDAAKWYKQLASQLKLAGDTKPKAILVVSAHWESSKKHTFFITNQKKHPELLYDYYGFPAETYELEYDCPGSPDLAQKVAGLVKNYFSQHKDESLKDVTCVLDSKRNLDHGVFIPLKLMYPKADIPVIEMSLEASLDPLLHFELGKALAPLRKEGVLIVGSGQATHGSFAHGKKGESQAHEFVDGLKKVLLSNKEDGQERKKQLLEWTKIPSARLAHPREEHLIPLLVSVGASEKAATTQLCDFWGGTFSLASFSFQD